MDDHILTLEKAKLFVKFPEIYRIFWKDWDVITEVENDALEYLARNGSFIRLPNVKSLTEEQAEILRGFSGYLVIGSVRGGE